MKKSVGIVTLYDPKPNYGNRLQNLAVQTVLEKMGFDTVTYSFEPDDFGLKSTMKYILQVLSGYRLSKNNEYWKGMPPKIFSFNKFNKRYIKTERIQSIEEVSQKDFYVVGSDQTWNAAWYENNDFKKNMYLLTFTDPAKRVCFAPSFGVDDLPEKMKPLFKKSLEKFPYLSVREEAGAKIIKELTGRDATVMIDPTMMLTADEWMAFERKPQKAEEGYILTYFLSPKCNAAKSKLDEVKGDRRVYELLDSEDDVTRASDPCEFLWLFDHADMVLTDSFHACIFSLLFNKPFTVYDRNWKEGNMNSRLETLLKKFDLERKYAGSGLENDLWEHDYTNGYKQLEVERQKAMEFLKKALGD